MILKVLRTYRAISMGSKVSRDKLGTVGHTLSLLRAS
eukprot:SAG11_NODE_21666_length_420_cov_5.778816_1_plen_36_part_10